VDDIGFSSAPPEAYESFSIARLIVGLLLLIPGAALYIYVQLLPALRTFATSQTSRSVLREGEYLGLENFTRLFDDPAYGQAVGYTALIVVVRLLIVAVIPPLVGTMVGAQGFPGRATNRVLMSALAVLTAPVAVIVLYAAFISPVWGTSPSPLTGQPVLSSPDGARGSVLLVDAIITLGIAVVVGGAAFMAVMRGRDVSMSSSRAGIGVWLLGLLLVAASGAATFTVPYLLTGGGPAMNTTTTALSFFNQAFRNLNFGYGSAQAVFLIIPAAFFGLMAGIIIWVFRLRLSFTPAARPAEAAGLLRFLSVPLIVLLGLPALGLFIWGIWLTASAGGFSRLSEVGDTGRLLSNTITAPWLAIWLVQIPLTYLIGMALGFVRPISRAVSNIIFLVFIVLAFIPSIALSISWYTSLTDMGALNSNQAIAFGFVVNVFSLIVFKLFFDGAYERNRVAINAGQAPTDAFLNTTLLPSLGVVLLVGAGLSFASAQNLLWPLIVTNDRALYGFPIQLAAQRGSFGADYPLLTGLAVTFTGLLALIFLPIFALLQVLVVDRLAILAGPPTDDEWAKPKRPLVEQKPTIGY
jgi:ABC-type sugar transport system permease subunit